MGIVVSVAMLLGLIIISIPRLYYQVQTSWLLWAVLAFLVPAGLWNSAWYGLQYLSSFWGLAAFVSGILILLSGYIIYSKSFVETPYSVCFDTTKQLIRILVIVGLSLCFLLYAITIIRINLGMSIIH